MQIPDQENLENFEYEEPAHNDIFDAPITENEVKNNIKCIRSGKSGGPDGILIEMLKTTILLICPILTKLFTISWTAENFRKLGGGGGEYIMPYF